ncbi:MAG: aconitate hydratase, partial [OCS116 cluster bacterium]|nr:aconitate hydratase [OCS116 cluster bacterium]
GNMNVDITKDVLAVDKDGNDVYLKDIWPTNQEIAEIVAKCITREMFVKRYADVFKGDKYWQAIQVEGGLTYNWNSSSTYIQHPPYFEGMGAEPTPLPGIEGARVMALLGDSVTTDHISPAGQFKPEHPAGQYLVDRQVAPKDFNSYGSRRGNHEVMMRGTFANIRIKNAMIPGSEGGVTRHYPSGDDMWIYDAAEKYKADGVPLVIFGGKEYGTGSSRDWAAKGTNLLGVRAVITESFERIHRSNLVGMGVLPLQFKDGVSWESLGLKGDEIVSINGIDNLSPRCDLEMVITMGNGDVKKMPVLCRIDTLDELDYVQNGGILQYVLRDLAK